MIQWSLSLCLVSVLGAAETSRQFDNYTQAYRTASAARRPMLVILNPPEEAADPTGGNVATSGGISIDALKHQNATLRNVLQDYVVAEIDTGTEHGRKVYELFGSPQLPRIVVIDDHQKKQIFRTSDALQPATLSSVLQRYKNGAPPASVRPVPSTPSAIPATIQGGGCPNCQRSVMRFLN